VAEVKSKTIDICAMGKRRQKSDPMTRSTKEQTWSIGSAFKSTSTPLRSGAAVWSDGRSLFLLRLT
jgi:hypothetical protein